MAQYYTDFSEYSDGDITDQDWTEYTIRSGVGWEVISDSKYTNGKALKYTSTDDYFERTLIWNEVERAENVEILAKIYPVNEYGGDMCLVSRWNESQYYDIHPAYYTYRNDSNRTGTKYAEYGDILTDEEEGKNIGTSNPYWIKFDIDGSDWSIDTWTDSSYETVDHGAAHDVEGKGNVGLSSANGYQEQVDVFSVGTNGDPAPEPPDAPSNLIINDSSTEGEITLDWTDNGGSGFYIYRATSSGSSKSDYTQVADVASPPYTDTGLEDGERYYYRVSAYT